MKLCCYDLKRECLKHCSRTEECVGCIIEEAQELNPYKIIGNINSFTEYNEGWNDALDYIASRLFIKNRSSNG